MGFAFSYRMRERARELLRWLEERRRIASLVAAAGVIGLVYLLCFARPFASREMVILYRPSPDGGAVVFNLGNEYRLRNIRLVALNDQGHEAGTLWRFEVPRGAPKLSTFVVPPDDLRAQAGEALPLEPGRMYRLKVAASGARGVADFRLDPMGRSGG